MLNKRGQPLPD